MENSFGQCTTTLLDVNAVGGGYIMADLLNKLPAYLREDSGSVSRYRSRIMETEVGCSWNISISIHLLISFLLVRKACGVGSFQVLNVIYKNYKYGINLLK
jgi:hypothetical protein